MVHLSIYLGLLTFISAMFYGFNAHILDILNQIYYEVLQGF
jgi:hypothetical protein